MIAAQIPTTSRVSQGGGVGAGGAHAETHGCSCSCAHHTTHASTRRRRGAWNAAAGGAVTTHAQTTTTSLWTWASAASIVLRTAGCDEPSSKCKFATSQSMLRVRRGGEERHLKCQVAPWPNVAYASAPHGARHTESFRHALLLYVRNNNKARKRLRASHRIAVPRLWAACFGLPSARACRKRACRGGDCPVPPSPSQLKDSQRSSNTHLHSAELSPCHRTAVRRVAGECLPSRCLSRIKSLRRWAASALRHLHGLLPLRSQYRGQMMDRWGAQPGRRPMARHSGG